MNESKYKQLMLEEINQFTDDLENWNGVTFRWGTIEISKVASDIIQVSTKKGNFVFTNESTVAEFVIMNVSQF